jgi:hypothetical protein
MPGHDEKRIMLTAFSLHFQDDERAWRAGLEPSRAAKIIFPVTGRTINGTEIFQEGFGRCRARNEEAQGRNAEERPIRQDGQKPQAGDRYRSFRGQSRRRESPEEGIEEKKDGQEDNQEDNQEAKSQKVTAP